MRRLALSAFLILSAAASAPAVAQPAPSAAAVRPGATVEDARGQVLGRIETIIVDAQDRPSQVLIRTTGLVAARTQLKSLPVSALKPKGDGYATPLRKAEFDALPAVPGR